MYCVCCIYFSAILCDLYIEKVIQINCVCMCDLLDHI